MKNLLILTLIIGLIVSCVEMETMQGKVVQIYCVVKENTPFLVKDSTKIIKKINVKLESGYRIKNSHKDSLSFIAISSFGDAFFNYIGLFDRNGNSIINVVDTTREWNSKIVPNPKYIAYSNNKKYYLLKGGTSASKRILQIFNEKGNEVDRISVIASIPEEGHSWNEKNELIYYVLADGERGGGMCKVEKIIWKNEETTNTKETLEVYME